MKKQLKYVLTAVISLGIILSLIYFNNSEKAGKSSEDDLPANSVAVENESDVLKVPKAKDTDKNEDKDSKDKDKDSKDKDKKDTSKKTSDKSDKKIYSKN